MLWCTTQISSIINKGMGIDCHMRNLKKQFFTTISNGVVKDIIHIVVLVLVIFVYDKVYRLMMLLILFFFWRSLGEKNRVDSRQKRQWWVLTEHYLNSSLVLMTRTFITEPNLCPLLMCLICFAQNSLFF